MPSVTFFFVPNPSTRQDAASAIPLTSLLSAASLYHLYPNEKSFSRPFLLVVYQYPRSHIASVSPPAALFLVDVITASSSILTFHRSALAPAMTPLRTNCSIAFRTCTAGNKRGPIGSFVTGERSSSSSPCNLIICSISALSYVRPSSAQTGSTGNSSVRGQTNSSATPQHVCLKRFASFDKSSMLRSSFFTSEETSSALRFSDMIPFCVL
mmetsp:Transcript_54077/g.161886  ORF Transcript_54077/g.161886 Transcript_54077/m.161886 type:complete len:211 (+) Transcript_54077:395-1027(+)